MVSRQDGGHSGDVSLTTCQKDVYSTCRRYCDLLVVFSANWWPLQCVWAVVKAALYEPTRRAVTSARPDDPSGRLQRRQRYTSPVIRH